MFDGEGGKRRSSSDVLVVPFIFVPHGDPTPTEWLAKRSDPIRVSATFVPRNPASDQTPRWSGFSSHPGFGAAPISESGESHPTAGSEAPEPPPRPLQAEPVPNAPDHEDAIATYMRVNDFLDEIGLGRPGRASMIAAASTTPGTPNLTRTNAQQVTTATDGSREATSAPATRSAASES